MSSLPVLLMMLTVAAGIGLASLVQYLINCHYSSDKGR